MMMMMMMMIMVLMLIMSKMMMVMMLWVSMTLLSCSILLYGSCMIHIHIASSAWFMYGLVHKMERIKPNELRTNSINIIMPINIVCTFSLQ